MFLGGNRNVAVHGLKRSVRACTAFMFAISTCTVAEPGYVV